MFVWNRPENSRFLLFGDSNYYENKPETNKKQYVRKLTICNNIENDAFSS